MTSAGQKTAERPVRSVLLLIVSFLFLLAAMSVLSPCGPKEDGTFMNCHYAGTALRIIACAAVLVSAARLVIKDMSKTLCCVLDLLLIALAAAAAFIPGNVIHLCMMPQMRCRAVMKPGAIVFAILLAAAAVADLFAGRKKDRK